MLLVWVGRLVAQGHCLTLCNAVGQQPLVVLFAFQSIAGNHDEIGRKAAGALMQQLVVCMLTVCPTATPQDLHGPIIYTLTAQIHGLAITLHFQLLKKIGQ